MNKPHMWAINSHAGEFFGGLLANSLDFRVLALQNPTRPATPSTSSLGSRTFLQVIPRNKFLFIND